MYLILKDKRGNWRATDSVSQSNHATYTSYDPTVYLSCFILYQIEEENTFPTRLELREIPDRQGIYFSGHKTDPVSRISYTNT